ncbi:MAG TPA: carboxypeptidase-like regulatory domain-containing protein [Hanamia sp.]|nr:carboxypeptidase-like regulatory domain-containing protein [Hanamia sp.]
MKKLITLLFLFPLFAHAQNSFKAIIKDSATNENLVGVTVFIHKLKMGASSDSSGMISINNIPKGEYGIVFSSIGYAEKKNRILFPIIATATG